MPKRRQVIGIICLTLSGSAFGQTGPTLTGLGYSLPAWVRVAPGQIATLYVTGLKTVLPSQAMKAAGVPLPTTLGGISVTLNQLNGPQSMPVPLLSVQQASVCDAGGTADCLVTAVTVQIPFELVPPALPVPDFAATPTQLVVSENGVPSKAFKILPVIDNIHVLNTCDVTVFGPVDPAKGCSAVAAHGDGTLVTASNPAKAGEEIVVYAVGLGQTTPVPKSGQPTPPDAPALNRSVYAQFDFRPNAAPTRPYADTATAGISGLATPAFVGLTPNQIGLYQINIQLPSVFPHVPPCAIGLILAGALTTIVGSNLTIDIGGMNTAGLSSVTSFDGAAICVQAPGG